MMFELTGSTKRIIQVLVLVILGAGVLIVLFVLGRKVVTPPDYLPPTIDPLVPTFNFSVSVTENRQAVVSGSTNLPDGSNLVISVIEENGNYSGQEQVAVSGGSYSSGRFGPETGLNFGSYTVEVKTAPWIDQPEAVQERIGPQGVNLVGDQAVQEGQENKARGVARFEVLIPPPVLRDCNGPGIGLTQIDIATNYEITVQAAYKTKTAYGIDPTAPASQDYGREFVFVDLVIRNLDTKARFLSYDNFILFLKEGFPFTELTPYTFYPDARFTVNKKAKEDGFFGLQEIQPGAIFTGRVAFMVPDISHNYVFSSNPNSCFEQDDMLQCHQDYPVFDFRD